MIITDERLRASADLLTEMLPYVDKFHGKQIVVKYGGNAMVDASLKNEFARDVVLMKKIGMHPIIVHGGGAQISTSIKAAGLETHFVDGLRVTDKETMKIVENVLVNDVNGRIVDLIRENGGQAFGLGGWKNGQFIRAKKIQSPLKSLRSNKPIDIGFVGEVEAIKTSLLKTNSEGGWIPVIAPVGLDEKGNSYNINADTVAGHVAEAINAEKFIILTNTHGVEDENGELIAELHSEDIHGLIDSGVISGGMIPKLDCVLHALDCGVHSVHIIDGRLEKAILLEIFTDKGIGTMISADKSILTGHRGASWSERAA